MDTTFRSVTETPLVESTPSEFTENKVGASVADLPEPISSENSANTVLDVIGLEDNIFDLPSEEQSKIQEIAGFVQDIIKAKGKNPTTLSYAKEIDELKAEVGLDYEADPMEAIERLSGVIKAYKNLAFLGDRDRKSMFMKLAKMPNTKSMNELVFKEMNNRRVWQ